MFGSRRFFFTLTALILLSSIPLGCNTNTNYQPKTVCVLYDLSGSTDINEIRDRYLTDTRKILQAMRLGDNLFAALITDRSITEPRMGFQHQFIEKKPHTDNPLAVKNWKKRMQVKMNQTRDSLLTVARQLLFNQNKKIMQTKILGALQNVERIFEQFPTPRKRLVIFSDMVEESEWYDFTAISLTPDQRKKIIARERSAGRLPDLAGVEVYVVATTAKSNEEVFLRIRDFWKMYFDACGASIRDYGNVLLKFEP